MGLSEEIRNILSEELEGSVYPVIHVPSTSDESSYEAVPVVYGGKKYRVEIKLVD